MIPVLVRLLLLSVLAILPSRAMAAGTSGPRLPRHIVLIMADDLGIEGLGCYGGTDYRTPRLDELASSGLRFTHAYSQPLCTPTRVQLMTGRYNHRNWQFFGIMPKGETTLGHLMKGFGFRTVIGGKWQLTSYDPPDFPGAAKRRGQGMHPRDAGFDEYSLHHAEHTEDAGSRYADPTFLRNGKLHTVKGAYGEDVTVDFLLDFMARHRTEPVFVYYPMALPHHPMNPTPRSAVWSDPRRRLEKDDGHFKDMVEYTDTIVGRLVDGIGKLGLRDDTLILFYSDNGTDRRHTSHLGSLAVPGGKGLTTQSGIRVPLIAHWPRGTPAGQVSSQLVDASDFFPTLAALAGRVPPPGLQIDGRSFAAVLLGNQPPSPREACFFWYDPRPGYDKEKFSRAVFALDHDYKYFSDGRLYAISGLTPTERLLEPAAYSEADRAAREKLHAVIGRMMTPPLAPAVTREVDAFGEPVVR